MTSHRRSSPPIYKVVEWILLVLIVALLMGIVAMDLSAVARGDDAALLATLGTVVLILAIHPILRWAESQRSDR
jgi:hypothetical protein